MRKFLRQTLYLFLMLAASGIAYRTVDWIDDQIHSPYLDFEQFAAAGLLAAIVIPLFIYNRSATLQERLLTVFQFTLLCITAVFGVTVRFFILKGVWLFLSWFACAYVAAVVAFYMVHRFWIKNGTTPTPEELEHSVNHFANLQMFEVVLEESIQHTRSLSGDGLLQLQLKERALSSIQDERRRLELQLKEWGVKDIPVLGNNLRQDAFDPPFDKLDS